MYICGNTNRIAVADWSSLGAGDVLSPRDSSRGPWIWCLAFEHDRCCLLGRKIDGDVLWAAEDNVLADTVCDWTIKYASSNGGHDKQHENRILLTSQENMWSRTDESDFITQAVKAATDVIHSMQLALSHDVTAAAPKHWLLLRGHASTRASETHWRHRCCQGF